MITLFVRVQNIHIVISIEGIGIIISGYLTYLVYFQILMNVKTIHVSPVTVPIL